MLTFFFPATIIEISAPALTPCTRPWLPIYCLKDTKSPAYQHAALSRPAAPSLEALFGAVLSHLSHVQLCGPLSSILAWKIPWMEEPGRLQSMGLLRVGHDWATSLSLFSFHALEKEMATHSSILAWRILGTTEPGGLPSMGSHRVGHDWSDLA